MSVDGKLSSEREARALVDSATTDPVVDTEMSLLEADLDAAIAAFGSRISDAFLMGELAERVGFVRVSEVRNGQGDLVGFDFFVIKDPPSGRDHRIRRIKGALAAASNSLVWQAVNARAFSVIDRTIGSVTYSRIRMAR